MSARRRRVAGVLAGTTAVSIVAGALSGAAALWAAAAVAGVLAVSYCAAALRLARRAAQRDIDLAFGLPASAGRALDWDQLDQRLRVEDLGGLAAETPLDTELTTWAAARFLAAYFAALALTPLVVLLHLISGDKVDLQRYALIGRLIRFQDYWRSQSLRVITAGVAATATVTVAGATTGTAFAASTYTVQAGDTLSSIAASNGTTVSALAAANDLANPNFIMAGQTLGLSGATEAASVASTSYTVQAGDTLSGIAASHGTTVSALVAANHISDPNLIYAGAVLSLSGGSGSATEAASTSYTVQPGDTLGAIAASHGTTVSALAAANHLSNPNLIYAGQVLTLSGSSSGTAPAAAPAATPSSSTPPVQTSVTTPSVSGAAAAVRTALAQVGVPYLWGGASPSSGFDCSGLVMYAWAAGGVSLPHYSVAQYEDTTRISESELQPGDIVFYDTGVGAQPQHEALYIGNGQVVASNTPGTVVQSQSITYDGPPMGFGRVG